jgi:hypothetical protein
MHNDDKILVIHLEAMATANIIGHGRKYNRLSSDVHLPRDTSLFMSTMCEGKQRKLTVAFRSEFGFDSAQKNS